MMDQLPQERLKRNVVRGRLDVIGKVLFNFFTFTDTEMLNIYFSFIRRFSCIICWGKYTKFHRNNLLFYFTYA